MRSRRRWPIDEKRRIVEETLEPGTSVARVAQRNGVNANQVFTWCRLYRQGRLGNSSTATKLLPVTIASERVTRAAQTDVLGMRTPSGALEIQLPKATLHLTGSVDVVALRTALECLLR
ncbi:MAG: transposase [Candidatus Eremiobacteraeota bacterium]|nr:transposase [Candidatus Eremiobacteraeota bacterium]